MNFESWDKAMTGYKNYDSFSNEDKHLLYQSAIDELIAAGY